MNYRPTAFRQHVLTLFAISACLFSMATFAANMPAANQTTDQIAAQYKQDIADCNAGRTNEDKATCKREAGAAYEEARRNRLVNNQQAGTFAQNATERCNALPDQQKQECLMQMSDQNTVIKGSVDSGGILRETTITVPAQ